jgi:subtilase family serine protease
MGLISSERCVSTGGSIPCLSAYFIIQGIFAQKAWSVKWQYNYRGLSPSIQ